MSPASRSDFTCESLLRFSLLTVVSRLEVSVWVGSARAIVFSWQQMASSTMYTALFKWSASLCKEVRRVPHSIKVYAIGISEMDLLGLFWNTRSMQTLIEERLQSPDLSGNEGFTSSVFLKGLSNYQEDFHYEN